ncbi:MAG TPA: UDP-N-acetylmuramoyl-L-alanine--D-glutamate ligase [Thermoclostridium sp.]
MNKALESYKERIRGKKAAVLGFGVSNRPLAKTIAQWGADVTVFDRKNEEEFPSISEYKDLGIKFSLGQGYLDNLKGFDMIFRTPGMRFDIPEIQRELANGAELTSEMEVFFKLCPAKIYAVTGSDGKTTTTTLIYETLKQEGYNCYLGGNIGTPLIDKVEEIDQNDKVVLELSSFQLLTMKDSPDVAVITNVSPNHLDIHKSMEEYIDAKKNIYRHQSNNGRVVLNYDNLITRSFVPEVKGRLILFSIKEECATGAFLKGNTIVYREGNMEKEILSIDDIKLPGMHNVENYLAAISAVIPEVSTGSIINVARNFAGVEHRNEFVRTVNGVSFYNDSIGSSPTRTTATLKSFKRKVILIAGGYDKKLCYDELGEIIHNNVKSMVLMGNTADKIEKAYKDYVQKEKVDPIPVIRVSNMEEAVNAAYKLAASGDIVVLSPASASFDLYSNFMERGNHFKEIVQRLQTG